MAVNYDTFITEIIKPLIVYPDDLMVTLFSEENNTLTYQVIVNEKDLGRVIGKGGKIANSIRTIVYATASREGIRIQINIDSL